MFWIESRMVRLPKMAYDRFQCTASHVESQLEDWSNDVKRKWRVEHIYDRVFVWRAKALISSRMVLCAGKGG